MKEINNCCKFRTPIAKTLVVKPFDPDSVDKPPLIKEHQIKIQVKEKKVKFDEPSTAHNFSYLDDNYFEEYEKCLRGKTYNSDRYKRLSSIEINKFDLGKAGRKPFKKQKRYDSANYFEYQLPNKSSCSNRIHSSIKNLDKVHSKVDCNFNGIMASRNNKKPLQIDDKIDKTLSNASEKENNPHIINNTSERGDKPKESCDKKNTFVDSLEDTPLPKKYKEEYFSTELLLQDTDDIFHINEDFFTTEQCNDKELLEKKNYNFTNGKILDHFKNQHMKDINQSNKINTLSIANKKEGMEDEDKLSIYNSCKRRNIKKISNMMAATKHITKNKSIYTNFDYSDGEYYDSSSSSDSSYTKYHRHRKKRSHSPKKKHSKNEKSTSQSTNMEISNEGNRIIYYLYK